jgi:hypothetical protein
MPEVIEEPETPRQGIKLPNLAERKTPISYPKIGLA